MRQYKYNMILVAFFSFLLLGCGTDSTSSNGGGQSKLTLNTDDIRSSFTIKLIAKGMGTGKEDPYMVSYAIIDKEKITGELPDRYGGMTSGYEDSIFSKNTGNNGTVISTCKQSFISPGKYIRYLCETTLSNGTKLSDNLDLLMGKTYVLYLWKSFMWRDGVGVGTDDTFEHVSEIKL